MKTLTSARLLKKIILPAIGVFLFLSAHGQGESKLHFGMKIEPALAWLKTDTKGFENNGSEFRFAYCFVTEFKFAERYSFATGIDVANRGGSLRSTTTDSTTSIILEQDLKLRYIELPLTLKLKTNEIGYLTYFLQFGIAPGFNIRAVADETTRIQLAGGQSTTSSEDKVDIGDDIGFFNLSMKISLGTEYRFSGNTAFILGITYSNGFIDIASNNDIKVNSNYLGLSLGVLF